MSYKIENITATVPVKGIQYCDLRPLVSADSIEEYKEALAEVGKMAGNPDFTERMLGVHSREGWEKIATPEKILYFDPLSHSYEDEDGTPYLSGSTFASQFEKPFEGEKIAPQIAKKRNETPDQVLKGWELKGEVARTYGTALHKALECGLKYHELPNSPHLALLVQDALDMFGDKEVASEQFVCDHTHHLCGTIDALVNLGDKHVKIVDYKSNDVFKKTALTDEAKQLWPLEGKMISIYQLQLSFYAYILLQMGYKVDALEVWYLEGEAWKIAPLKVLDITRGLR